MAKYRIVKQNGMFFWEKRLFLWEWYRSMFGHITPEEAMQAAKRDAANNAPVEVVAELGRLP